MEERKIRPVVYALMPMDEYIGDVVEAEARVHRN
jgi:hypothetical protein